MTGEWRVEWLRTATKDIRAQTLAAADRAAAYHEIDYKLLNALYDESYCVRDAVRVYLESHHLGVNS